ncbi:MAG: hypothetical protein LBP89_10300 [Helicobacteraceae bacterium]|jgi:hypothetical protein|nr:hypothetical protein [Helicobacteraceae bacterium]
MQNKLGEINRIAQIAAERLSQLAKWTPLEIQESAKVLETITYSLSAAQGKEMDETACLHINFDRLTSAIIGAVDVIAKATRDISLARMELKSAANPLYAAVATVDGKKD